MAQVVGCRVIAVHAICTACGDHARVDLTEEDSFTSQILTPLASWWTAHRAPVLASFEAVVGDHDEEWQAT